MNRILLALLTSALVASPCAAAGTARARAHRHAAPAAPHAPTSPSPDARDRTLDDIHIEGEISVPQVLFITARDQRRFLEFQHRSYLRTSTQLGEATALPRWTVVRTSPSPADKETAR